MKIALCGTAPASMAKAPFGDPSFLIWGCSPGLYPIAARVDAWFELHRWEPPVIGKPQLQVPWFTPEYCLWMAQLKCPVWMQDKVAEVPNSMRLPHEDLVAKYGHFFFTSSLAWMAAMAIEAILINRKLSADKDPRAVAGEDVIGFWGVDMAANEEYGYQRAGCQYFATLASCMGIRVHTPPESDLMVPPALYGISEGTHRHIKLTARRKELQSRKAMLEQQVSSAQAGLNHLNGALDDMDYHMNMWLHEGDIRGPDYEQIFPPSRVAEALESKG